jgi:hypothetical protein
MPDLPDYLQAWIERFPSLNRTWQLAGSWFVGNTMDTWGIGWNEGDGSYIDQVRAEGALPLGECDLLLSPGSYVDGSFTCHYVEAMLLVPSNVRWPPAICSSGIPVGVSNPGPGGLVLLSSSVRHSNGSEISQSPDFTEILDDTGKSLANQLMQASDDEPVFQRVCGRMMRNLEGWVLQGDLPGQGWVQLGDGQSSSLLLRASDGITFEPFVDENDNCVALFINMD